MKEEAGDTKPISLMVTRPGFSEKSIPVSVRFFQERRSSAWALSTEAKSENSTSPTKLICKGVLGARAILICPCEEIVPCLMRIGTLSMI